MDGCLARQDLGTEFGAGGAYTLYIVLRVVLRREDSRLAGTDLRESSESEALLLFFCLFALTCSAHTSQVVLLIQSVVQCAMARRARTVKGRE